MSPYFEKLVNKNYTVQNNLITFLIYYKYFKIAAKPTNVIWLIFTGTHKTIMRQSGMGKLNHKLNNGNWFCYLLVRPDVCCKKS